MNPPEEFYIGWEAKSPAGVARHSRSVVVSLLLAAVVMGVLVARAQRMIGVSVFEWGEVKEFTGIFEGEPYPHLLVHRPGSTAGQSTFSSYYLVKPFKFGLDSETVARFDGESVALKGTLIYRGNQTMIETKPEWIELSASEERPARSDQPSRSLGPASVPNQSLGEQMLTGEIVDSKCFLGVMNPGQLTPHRACAIRCISGGIPPVLLVRREDGPPIYLLLVSGNGEPVNKQVLDLVAEPIEVTGEVQRQGDLLILRADPRTYRRIR